MSEARVVFDQVWKKFRRGEPHDSLRDLIPALVTGLFRPSPSDSLAEEEFWALEDVSFEVRPGETLGIIGRNGSGKSTTLKLLTRILKPTRGRSEVRGRVGALIELAAGFHPDLTGRENVFLQGAIMGMRRREIERHFDEIVDFAGIGEFMDTQVKRYSSGMQARLGFSVAAHLEPDVLLIDEVLAVGDLSFQQKCYERLREFRRSGVAIAFVSHNMQAISMLCDRVLYLRPGAPPHSGTVGEMVTAYVTTDAASADPRVAVRHAELTMAEGSERVAAPVPPGIWLTLDLEIQAVSDLPRAGLALLFHRADGLLVFDGSSILDGEPPFDLPAGGSWHIRVTFRANLLRGTYAVSGHLFEEHRRWPAVQLGILGSFVVAETTRAGGVADLEPRYLTCNPVAD
jgi:lipopolysaccharide transport system ATP-binding protein